MCAAISPPSHPIPPSPRRYDLGLPAPLLAACAVCRSGVKRAHLVDARMDGGLLLELYSRWVGGVGVGMLHSRDASSWSGRRRTYQMSLRRVWIEHTTHHLWQASPPSPPCRDGVGCMISTDFYEGIRRAGLQVRWQRCTESSQLLLQCAVHVCAWPPIFARL